MKVLIYANNQQQIDKHLPLLEEGVFGHDFSAVCGPRALNNALLYYPEKFQYVICINDTPDPGFDDITLDLMNKQIPYLLRTYKDDELDVMLAFTKNADDVISMDKRDEIFLRRVRNILDRHAGIAPVSDVDETTTIGDVSVNINKGKAYVKDQPLRLTHAEVRLLHYLIKNPGFLKNRTQIMDYLGLDEDIPDRTVDSYIKRIRIELNHAGIDGKKAIITIYGAGYKANDKTDDWKASPKPITPSQIEAPSPNY